MAEGSHKAAECDLKLPAGGEGKITYADGCGAGRAYLIGNGDEGKIEGTDGRPLYHTMAEGSQ